MSSLFGALRWIGPRTLLFVVGLVALELGLYHLGDFGKWVVQEQSERYGWRMLPNQAGWSRNYDVREDINAQGFRDGRDWGRPGDLDRDARLRVAVVGNSMTYGTSVPVEATWPRVLEDLLREGLAEAGQPREVLVMNFATQGYTFEQMARLYEDVVSEWRPELLLWPTIAPDARLMRPSRDDAEYAFRRQVIRTATFDMLRKHVMRKWIPDPTAPPFPDDPAQQREAVFAAIEGPLVEAASEFMGPEEAQGLAERLFSEIRRRSPKLTTEQLLGVLYLGLSVMVGSEPGDAERLIECWSAIEPSLPDAVWELVDKRFKISPYHPRYDFIWDARQRRMTRLAAAVEGDGGRVALVSLPMFQRFERLMLERTAPSPFIVWDIGRETRATRPPSPSTAAARRVIRRWRAS
ncbi:MAG: hypothetical protein AAFZ65_17180, partial [Planctomycetota bacterium]